MIPKVIHYVWLGGAKPNTNGYSEQEKRVFGYLSEMLMDVWIDEITFYLLRIGGE